MSQLLLRQIVYLLPQYGISVDNSLVGQGQFRLKINSRFAECPI